MYDKQKYFERKIAGHSEKVEVSYRKGKHMEWQHLESCPEDEWVLLYTLHNVEMGIRMNDKFCDPDRNYKELNPVRWMPLPLPPKDI